MQWIFCALFFRTMDLTQCLVWIFYHWATSSRPLENTVNLMDVLLCNFNTISKLMWWHQAICKTDRDSFVAVLSFCLDSGLDSGGRGGPLSPGIILTEGLNFLLLALCLNKVYKKPKIPWHVVFSIIVLYIQSTRVPGIWKWGRCRAAPKTHYSRCRNKGFKWF